VRKTRDLAIYTLLAAGCISQFAGQSQAALFDFLRPKRAATADRREQPKSAASQSAVRQAGYWQQPGATSAVTQATFFDSGAHTGWGYDSSPCSDSGCNDSSCKGFLQSLFCCSCSDLSCFNCGECDHCITCTRHHRRKCNQTWYPRVAPYCETNWGWTQPCWRRMDDNYNCPPRAQAASTRPQPAPAPVAAPAAEPLPEPEPPAIPSTRRELPKRPQIANPSPRFPRSEPPLAEKTADDGQAQPTRFTGFADTVESDADADDEEGVEGTLESQMESADGDMETEEEADPPAIEDAEE
jgi:hypothetical protein